MNEDYIEKNHSFQTKRNFSKTLDNMSKKKQEILKEFIHICACKACNEIDRVLDVLICKNLFLCNRQKTEFYLLMMPGDKPFKTKELPSQIGSARLSFAPEEYMEEYLDIHPGAVSVMGLMNDSDNHVRLLVDEDVLMGEYIGCHPCVNTSSLKIKTKDITEIFLKAVHHDMTVVKLTGE